MSKGQSLQDPFLNALRKERVPVSIFLVNGIKLQGTVEQMQALLADSIEANGEREDARGSTYDSVPPMRIQLKPLESGLWRTEPLGARVDAWLRERLQ